ncbi:MAG: hypothetical protein JWR84_2861 [Caulobacter sp.]|jgi:hypothetical protein|nr:hypothetical protein [Caulobacter sp.]
MDSYRLVSWGAILLAVAMIAGALYCQRWKTVRGGIELSALIFCPLLLMAADSLFRQAVRSKNLIDEPMDAYVNFGLVVFLVFGLYATLVHAARKRHLANLKTMTS